MDVKKSVCWWKPLHYLVTSKLLENVNCKYPDTKISYSRESEGEELTVEEVIYFELFEQIDVLLFTLAILF